MATKVLTRILIFAVVLGLIVAAAVGLHLRGAARNHKDRTVVGASVAAKAPQKVLWHCPMLEHKLIYDHPGKCIICGMDLVPFTPEETEQPQPGLETHVPITLTPERRQLIGVQIGTAEMRRVTRTIRAAGSVKYNDNAMSAVNLKYGGWIEQYMLNAVGDKVAKGQPLFCIYSPDLIKAERDYLNESSQTVLSLKYGGWIEELMVNTAGEAVRKGQPLFSIYSPDLLEAQRNYLSAREALASLGKDASADSRSVAAETVRSARERLVLWDFTADQFKKIETDGAPQRQVTIHSKVDGFVSERNVVIGTYVEAGKELLRLMARAPGAALTEIPTPPVPGEALQSETSARERLRLLGFTDEQFKQIDERGAPLEHMMIRSKVDGVVTERNVLLGGYAEAGRDILKLADLSAVWIDANIYENEIPLVKLFQKAKIVLASMPDKPLNGKVTYIYPALDESTRTLRVRLEFPNPGGLLKPGMYATVSLAVDMDEQLTVDADAVLDSGLRQIVFVDKGDGRLEPRQVMVGDRVEGLAIITKGLVAGEKVVTSGNFLVDSESQMKALRQVTGGMSQPETQPAKPAPAPKSGMPNMPGM